ncbi:MAG: MobP3 family relaxase [Clostridia bacterium]
MSRVIFKMSFKHPNYSDTKSKNIAHVNYIATRSGVDKTVTKADLTEELSMGVEAIGSDDQTYLKYIDERPKSHGLFGGDGIENPEDIQKELANIESYVWRGIVSLREEDAKSLGYIDKDHWQDMLRKKMPDMAAEMGIPFTNLRWVGAVHMEKGHPHAHIMLWEKEPQRTVGIINSKAIQNIRKMFTDEIFEEERLQLLSEKDMMRDLVRDIAQGDMSQVTNLLREIRVVGQELKSLVGKIGEVGVPPKLYSMEELKLFEMVSNLSQHLPGKGRIALKFMPDPVKEEVRAIADFMLQQPEFGASLERNLKAVEGLTRMYTGKEEEVQVARENAYKDIRDRVCQIILKGAVESLRENLFYIDQDLSQKAVAFIQDINQRIDLDPEQEDVMNHVAAALIKTGHADEEVMRVLDELAGEIRMVLPESFAQEIISRVKTTGLEDDINSLSTNKIISEYLNVLKLAGEDEQKAFSLVRELIKDERVELEKRLEDLCDTGLLEKEGESYKLTGKGIEETLKVKELDRAEKEIFKALELNDGAKFAELIDNPNIFSNLYTKDPDEVKISRIDIQIRTLFGEENSLNLKYLEKDIYEKYTEDDGKAEQEFNILKKRIENLALNGYLEFNKETGYYSFYKETEGYFAYDQEKNSYALTDEAITKFNIPKGMQFSFYDAKITLGYIDSAENGVLTKAKLNDVIKSETVNKAAHNFYNTCVEMLDNKNLVSDMKKYISMDDQGSLMSTEEGKWLGINLSKLGKYFDKSVDGVLDSQKLHSLCKSDHEYEDIVKRLDDQVKKGYVEKEVMGQTGQISLYRIIPEINNIRKLLYQINKAGGTLNRSDMLDSFERNVFNPDADKKFRSLSWRLDNLKKQNYLSGMKDEYSITEMGEEKRKDFLTPERITLRNTLDYLQRLGLTDYSGGAYQVTEKYKEILAKQGQVKEIKIEPEERLISKEIYNLIDRTQNNIDPGKLERVNQRIAIGKYLKDEYKDIEVDYDHIRSSCGVSDTTNKVLGRMATTLLVSGVDLEGTRFVINEWNERSQSLVAPDKINETIDKVYKNVSENSLWGKTTIISSKDWKDMFESFGIRESDIPKWIYKGVNWQSFNQNMGLSVINDLWKNTWRELERRRMQSEAQADMMREQMVKQTDLSKEAMVELSRKNQERGSLYKDEDELER